MAIYDGFIDRYMEDEMGDNDFEDKKSLMQALQSEEAKESQIPMQNAGLMQGAPQAPQAPPQVLPQQQRQQTQLQQPPQQQGGGMQNPYTSKPSFFDKILAYKKPTYSKMMRGQEEEAWERQAMQKHLANDPNMSDFPAMMKSGSKTLQKYAMSKMNTKADDDVSFKDYSAMDSGARGQYDRFKGRFDYKGGPDAPNAVREFKYFQGLDKAGKQEYLKVKRAQQMVDQGTHTTNINTGEQYGKNLIGKKVQEGYGTSTSKRLENYGAYSKSSQDSEYGLSRTMDSLDALNDSVSYLTTGLGGTGLSYIPGTSATDWEAEKETIISQLGLEKLRDLKSASPTGASGFGALSEKELKLLTSYVSNLEQAQSPEAIRKSIRRIQSHLKKAKGNVIDDRKRSERWFKANSRNQDVNRGGRYRQDTGPAEGIKWK